MDVALPLPVLRVIAVCPFEEEAREYDVLYHDVSHYFEIKTAEIGGVLTLKTDGP